MLRPGLGKGWGSQAVTWILMSQPRPSVGVQFGVATWSFEVATWNRLPGRVVTSARLTCARPAHTECVTCASCARDQSVVRTTAPTTWALRAQCARDLVSWCAHCAHNPVLCQCTVQVTVLTTVHEHCS